MASGVYKIINIINNKIYVGSSSNIEKRRKTHFYKLDHNIHPNRHLQSAYLKYGREAFLFEIVMLCSTDELVKSEQSVIDIYNFDNLYNIRKIAESNLGVMHSNESRQKCSDSKKGFVFTEEHKRKISESKRGFSPMFGKKFTQTHKDKIRESNRGLARTEETKQKMRDGFNYNARRHVFSVKCIETDEVFASYSEAATMFGVSVTTISNAAKYNKAIFKKYHFKKVD